MSVSSLFLVFLFLKAAVCLKHAFAKLVKIPLGGAPQGERRF